MRSFFYILLLGGYLVSCESVSLSMGLDEEAGYLAEDEPAWTPLPVTLEQYQKAVEIIQRRSRQIAEVEWYTLREVPAMTDSYPAEIKLNGIPYSSVKELDKFVGQDVSFYTFLTAAQNPKSVLYTENVGQLPYNGVNCAPYYGTVCSMTVNYVLGLNAPYGSEMYASLPFIEKVGQQNPSGMKIGDILWKKGHVALVEDIKYKADSSIASVHILESMGKYTKIKNYTLSSFIKRWEDSSWVLYRYMDFGRVHLQEDCAYLSSEDPDNFSVQYDSEICTSRGDRACYREGEDVVLNHLRVGEGDVKIFRDNQEFKVCTFEEGDVVLSDLPAGKYTASVNGTSTLFEVIQTSVTAKRVNGGILVSFDERNGVPEVVSLCTNTGGHKRIHVITEKERTAGSLWLDSDDNYIFVKVMFRGDYGRVSNDPIYLK